MAVTSGFFDSINKDRPYSASQIGKYLGMLISDGVYPNPSTNLQVLESSGMNIVVDSGIGWADSHWISNDSKLILPIVQSNMVYDRIDAVIMKLDKSQNVRSFDLMVKQGVPSETPVVPTMERSEEIREFCLATIRVKANVSKILQSDIVDTRADTKVCGWVTGLIEQVDTSTLFLQYKSAYEQYYEQATNDFEEWFKQLKDQISTSTLLREFSSTYVTKNNGETIIPIDIVNYTMGLDILDVYINGMRLIPEVEYTNNQTEIRLKKGLEVNQPVEKVVFKSIDGEKALTVIEQVEALQREVAQLKKEKANKDVYTATLTVAGWSNMQQSVTVQGVTARSILIADASDKQAGISVISQGTNTITFSCAVVPSAETSVRVVNLGE